MLLVVNGAGFVGVQNRGIGCQEGKVGGLGVAFSSLLCSSSS